MSQKFYILNGNTYDVEFRIATAEYTSLFRVEPSKGQISKGMKLEVYENIRLWYLVHRW